MAKYTFNITIPVDYIYAREQEEELYRSFMDELAELANKYFGKRCDECSVSVLYEEGTNVRFN